MNKIISIIGGLSILISACSLSPNLSIPEANYSLKHKNSSWENTISKEWWREFDDEKLNKVVQLALKNNKDLKFAFINMEQAATQLGINFSQLAPKFDADVGLSRTKMSANLSNKTNQAYTNDFKMGLKLSYEIDLWARYYDSYRASKSGFKASQYDYEGVKISLISNTIENYFNLVNAYENEKILEESYKYAKELYQINYKQFQLGALAQYELAQKKANLQSIALEYNRAKLHKESHLKALKILSSHDLNDILYEEQDYKPFNIKHFNVPSEISSDILIQRPDIASSLERLREQNYLIGVNRAAFLPNFSLTALLGLQSEDLNSLIQAHSKTSHIGGNFSIPIFHWGELSKKVKLAKLSKDKAFVNYQNVLIKAFGEIRYALIARKNMHLQYDKAQTNEFSYKRIYEIAKERYDVGEISFKDYLKARQDWLNSLIILNNTKYAYANSIVHLFKAFGGGFKK